MNKIKFVVGMSSEAFGAEEFCEHDEFLEAVEQMIRLRANAAKLNDNVLCTYTIRETDDTALV